MNLWIRDYYGKSSKHWVLQDNLFNEDGFRTLVDALERVGIGYSIHKVVPFSHELIPDFDHDGEVIVMGSYSLAGIAQAKGWKPGAFLDNLNYEVQLEHWGSKMLNCDATICRFGDVGAFETPRFLRPVDDSKAFAGTVFDWYEFSDWQAKVADIDGGETLTPDTPVMVCSLKTIYQETRVWIVDKQVVTASGYKRGTRVTSFKPDADTVHFAKRMARSWSPNRAYCMDVADTPDGHKIIEVNNINSSGFYGADMQKLVMALETMKTTTQGPACTLDPTRSIRAARLEALQARRHGEPEQGQASDDDE